MCCGRAELEREISGVRGNPVDVTDAIDTLYATGLVHLHGELVAPSRAARRMTQLNDTYSPRRARGRSCRSLWQTARPVAENEPRDAAHP
jgi:hypothetical protein